MADDPAPMPGFIQAAIGGVARHVLTGLAGALVVNAGLSQSQEAQFISGGAAVVVWLAGVLWSIMEKKARQQPATGA